MKKLFSTLAALLLMTTTLVPAGHAQSGGPFQTVGTWTFFIKIDGAPPCQCIQLARFRTDGTIDGPANDHFSSASLGEWRQFGSGDVRFAFVQNAINPDGTGGGVYVVRGRMTVNATGDQGTGTSTFQVLDVNGKVSFSGTATFTGTKLKLD